MSLVACESGDGKRPPEVARNTDHVSYATQHPKMVEQVTGELDEGKAKATELCGQFEGYADQIKDPTDNKKVAQVYDAADRSGKSGDYVERARQNRAFSRMLEENEGEIGNSVVASVHGAATHDRCPSPGNVAGAAKAGLKKGVDKRSEARLREANEAHRIIKRHREQLGKQNVATLEKQADEIAQASYIANVELRELQYELERLINDNEKVLRTIDREIEKEKKLQDRKDTSDAERKASEERVKELEETRDKLEAQKADLEERKKKLKKQQEEIKKIKANCNKQFNKLKESMGGKSSKDDDNKEDEGDDKRD